MSDHEHPLKTSSLKVLEDWALMLVDEIPEVSPEIFDKEKPVYMSWINLSGVIDGAVSIVTQENFMKILAGNLLGNIEEEPHMEDLRDAFKEMGNVLAGNFITEAYGEDVVFDLLNPNVSEISFTDLERFAKRNVVFGFMADDCPVAMTFSIKKG